MTAIDMFLAALDAFDRGELDADQARAALVHLADQDTALARQSGESAVDSIAGFTGDLVPAIDALERGDRDGAIALFRTALHRRFEPPAVPASSDDRTP